MLLSFQRPPRPSGEEDSVSRGGLGPDDGPRRTAQYSARSGQAVGPAPSAMLGGGDTIQVCRRSVVATPAAAHRLACQGAGRASDKRSEARGSAPSARAVGAPGLTSRVATAGFRPLLSLGGRHVASPRCVCPRTAGPPSRRRLRSADAHAPELPLAQLQDPAVEPAGVDVEVGGVERLAVELDAALGEDA